MRDDKEQAMRDVKKVIGVLMRVLEGEGDVQAALHDAYIKLIEFAHDCAARQQNSAIDRMGEMSTPSPGELTSREGQVLIALPDVVVFWSHDPVGWLVNVNPEFQQEAKLCKTPEELLIALQQAAAVCGMHRPQEPKQP